MHRWTNGPITHANECVDVTLSPGLRPIRRGTSHVDVHVGVGLVRPHGEAVGRERRRGGRVADVEPRGSRGGHRVAAQRVAPRLGGGAGRVRVGRAGRRETAAAPSMPSKDDHVRVRGARRRTPPGARVVGVSPLILGRRRHDSHGAEAVDGVAGRTRQGGGGGVPRGGTFTFVIDRLIIEYPVHIRFVRFVHSHIHT